MERQLQLGQLLVYSDESPTEAEFRDLPLRIVHTLTQGYLLPEEAKKEDVFGAWMLTGTTENTTITTVGQWLDTPNDKDITWGVKLTGGGSISVVDACFLSLRLSKDQLHAIFAQTFNDDIAQEIVQNYSKKRAILPEGPKFLVGRQLLSHGRRAS